jgi:hypothetical protein
VVGKMQIRVTASANGQSASAIITQANIAGANVGGGLSTPMKVLIVTGAVVGVAAAVYFGVRSTTSSTASSVIITPGIPTVGAPPN